MKAITERNFNIYTKSDGFQNRDKLNDLGDGIFYFFYYMSLIFEKYFPLIERIAVTQQDRTLIKNGKVTEPTSAEKKVLSSHYDYGKTIDIIIEPVYLMPYYAGIIYSCFKLNVYLGLERLHIHLDKTDKNNRSLRGYEAPFVNKEGQEITGIYGFTEKNIDWFLKKYLITENDSLENINAVLNIEEDSKKLLLSDFPNNNKRDMDFYQGQEPETALTELAKKIKAFVEQALSDVIAPILFAASAILILYLIYKLSPQKVRVIK